MSDIKLENNHGSIRLKFQVNGRRYSLTPVRGGKYEDQWDFKRAKAVADLIESDIKSGHFDSTLSKYKPQSIDSLQQALRRTQATLAEIKQKETNRVCLQELWDKYVEYKKPSLSLSTLEVDYKRRIGNTFKLLPTTNLAEAVAIRDWLIAHKPPTQVKKILTQFSACCNWAIDSRLIENNPFLKMTSKVRSPNKTEDDDINPLSAEERDRIIEAFEQNRHYCHYRYFVKFLFFTGCRPSEAIALSWSDVREQQINFTNSYVLGQRKKGLKTQKKRTIELNAQVQQILTENKLYLDNLLKNKRSFTNESHLVFPSAEGTYIDWHNFSNRAWKKILESLPQIQYRNPYQTRHTFITLALKTQKVNIQDLAKFCGNSPKIILERYAGVSRTFVMPVL